MKCWFCKREDNPKLFRLLDAFDWRPKDIRRYIRNQDITAAHISATVMRNQVDVLIEALEKEMGKE